MKELVVISGKGGTGKTSLVASFATLAAGEIVLVDCDVDAADLHLVLEPDVCEHHDFYSGHQAVIDPARCTGCGKCAELCRFHAIVTVGDKRWDDLAALGSACRDCSYCVRSCPQRMQSDIAVMLDDAAATARAAFVVDPLACEGCGVCKAFCPADAMALAPRWCGEWMVSTTRCGPMVHAKLGIAAENSGKLVSTVRSKARQLAEETGAAWLLIDGSPGIGCPVIASITGADYVLIVTEPTRSGLHDMRRVAELSRHFGIAAGVCVNKWDINPDLTDQIMTQAEAMGVACLGRVRYDAVVNAAQTHAQSIVEYVSDGCGRDVRMLWQTLGQHLQQQA